MSEQEQHAHTIGSHASAEDIQRRDDAGFQADIRRLLQEAEETRLRYMQQQRSRGFISMTIGILSVLAGAGGFGWYLLMHSDLKTGLFCMAGAIILPIFLHFWADAPLKTYTKNYKSNFMPMMAKALGKFKFHPARGISNKVIAHTGIIASYDTYEAEDCFMGIYKGVKVIFSEARLYSKTQSEAVFDGIFVLLEIPSKVIEGHTIITADHNMVKKWAGSRWQNMQTLNVQTDNPDWNIFEVFSDNPEAASLLVGERLLKELAEASIVFDRSPLSAVLFKEKFVFMAIPYEKDMFEASNMYVPVMTKQHALNCKKEIEQILEIIDVFDLYKAGKTSESFAT